MENEIENSLTNDIGNNLNENNIEKAQNKFLEGTIGKTINVAIDVGIRMLLPDAVEDHIIDLKDVLFKEGLGEGIKSAVNSAVNLGKSAIGMVTGKFENVSQAYNAVKSGGIIDTTSKLIDNVVKSANKKGLIEDSTAKIIKKGKNLVKECVSSNIEKTFMEQVDSIEKIGKYINNWNKYLEKRDIKGMEREYKKINDKLDKIIPLETTLKEIEAITNIQTLIKNKGGIEKLTNQEIELAKKLV